MKRKEFKLSRVLCMKCNMCKEFNNYICLLKVERFYYIIDYVNINIYDILKKIKLMFINLMYNNGDLIDFYY